MKKRYFFAVFAVLVALCMLFTACSEQTTNNADKKQSIDYLVLVNKQHKLPDNWEDIVELEDETDANGNPLKVEKEALKNFYELRNELLKEDIEIDLDSCYRSVEEQQNIWDEFTEQYGIDYVKKYVAVPGYSEHHTGLAIDICLIIEGTVINDNDQMIAEKERFARVHTKLADYGFILRYMEGKEDITGYGYEPWHLRYVGDAKIAREITSKGITLEEYLNK